MCLNQRNLPFPYVQIRGVIVNTCVFFVPEVNGEVSGMGLAKQGETCYQNCFDAHVNCCYVVLSWVSKHL